MTAKPTKLTKKVQFTPLKKLINGVSLIIFGVFILGGLAAGASLVSISWRAAFAMLGIKLIARIIIPIAARYEEMHSGKT